MPAPIAARIGSLTTYAFFAPALIAASTTARLCVPETPAGNSLKKLNPVYM